MNNKNKKAIKIIGIPVVVGTVLGFTGALISDTLKKKKDKNAFRIVSTVFEKTSK